MAGEQKPSTRVTSLLQDIRGELVDARKAKRHNAAGASLVVLLKQLGVFFADGIFGHGVELLMEISDAPLLGCEIA